MKEHSVPTVLAYNGERIDAELVFDEGQLWELDPTKDELLFPTGPDSFDIFLNRFSSNCEEVTLRFNGRDRHFKSLDEMLLALAETGFELVTIAFDGHFYRDPEDYFANRDWSLSRVRDITPAIIHERRELYSLVWS